MTKFPKDVYNLPMKQLNGEYLNFDYFEAEDF